MALINCIECGKQFSDRATACPQCGLPTTFSKEGIAQKTSDEVNVTKCSECGNIISSDQLTCQYCGNPDLNVEKTEEKPPVANENQNIGDRKTVSSTNNSSSSHYSIKKIMVASFIIIAMIFAFVAPTQYGKYKAINLVKNFNMYDTTIDQLVKSWVDEDTSVFQIYGWEAKKVSSNTYFVAFVFDDDQLKDNGYLFYTYEAELKTGMVRSISDNDILSRKYRELGYID